MCPLCPLCPLWSCNSRSREHDKAEGQQVVMPGIWSRFWGLQALAAWAHACCAYSGAVANIAEPAHLLRLCLQ